MSLKLWIATNADGRQSGFFSLPVRMAIIKEWITEGPDFRTIDFSGFNFLPYQTWEDEPVLIELIVKSGQNKEVSVKLSEKEIVDELDKRIAEQYERMGYGPIECTPEERAERRLAKINGLKYAKSSLLAIIAEKELDNVPVCGD